MKSPTFKYPRATTKRSAFRLKDWPGARGMIVAKGVEVVLLTAEDPVGVAEEDGSG